MEIPFRREDNSFSLWDSFLHISPSTREFDPRFNSLRARIPTISFNDEDILHRQNHVETKIFGDKFRILPVHIIVESS